MGCQGNKFIVPSPSADFTSNNQILKYQYPHYKNMWVYKNPTRGDDFTFWPMDYMLWSQIIYGHRTASISRKIVTFYGARTVRFLIILDIVDIVRCPVKFRYYLRFYAPVRTYGPTDKVATLCPPFAEHKTVAK